MDQTTNTLQREIDSTRDSMTQKLEQIESQVKGTAENVKSTVEQTVENVKENVKSTVEQTVETVKQNIDVKRLVDERPWTMFGASMLAGFVLGNMTGSEKHEAPYVRYGEPRYYDDKGYQPQRNMQTYHYYDRTSSPPRGAEMGATASAAMSDTMSKLGDEMDTLKDAAVATLTKMLHSTLQSNFPQLAEEFNRVRSERDQHRHHENHESHPHQSSNGGAAERKPATSSIEPPTPVVSSSQTAGISASEAQEREGRPTSIVDPKITRNP